MQPSFPIRIAVLGGLLAASFAALAASPQPGTFPITRNQVTEALRQDGLTSDPGQVRLAARVVASVSQPELEVVSMTAKSDQLHLRMACAGRAECLPFFATLAMPSQAAALAAQEHWLAGSSRNEDVGHAMKLTAVHNGSRLTMLLSGSHLHIKMPVICLSSGNLGQTVRVAGLDRKQVYAAEVVDEHTVKGQLP